MENQLPAHETCITEHVRIYRSDRGFTPADPPTPTEALPGTPEKIAVMKARLRAGQQLHHPLDRQLLPPLPTTSDSQMTLAGAG